MGPGPVMLLATLPLGPRCSVVLCPVLLCRKLNQGALRWALGVGTSPQAISEGRGQGTDVLLTNTSIVTGTRRHLGGLAQQPRPKTNWTMEAELPAQPLVVFKLQIF